MSNITHTCTAAETVQHEAYERLESYQRLKAGPQYDECSSPTRKWELLVDEHPNTYYSRWADPITYHRETRTWVLGVGMEFGIPIAYCPHCGEKLPDNPH